MAQVQQPVVVTEAGTVVPAPAPVVPTLAPVENFAPTVNEPTKTDGEIDAVAPVVENKKEEKKEETPVEPIYSGALGYKAPGLKNAFRFAKKHFWFGEEPVPASSLSQYLRGEKAEVAHPVAAWSSQTGKGLLYFVKHADQTESPAGVINLADVTDLSKDGFVAFHFKLHGQKHSFEAQNLAERNGWFIAVEKAIEDAKSEKESMLASEGYKEHLTKLGKPATLAATAAKESSTPKKSTDGTPKPVETETPTIAEPAASPARAGSASSSSSGEDKKKSRKAKSKSRSVSRGKRASIFGNFLGKKDKAEDKPEDKEEITEIKKDDTLASATTDAPIAAATAPVIPEDVVKPVDPKLDEAAIVAPVTEEKKVIEEKPKPTKRASIFGNFVEKLKSPTTEKRESEVGLAPVVPAKDTEVVPEAPKVEETPAVTVVAPIVDTTVEAPKTEETKPVSSTPAKEKSGFSFGKFLGGAREKVKSPSTDKPHASEAPKIEEPVKVDEPITPALVEPVAPAAEPLKEEPVEEETPATSTTPTAQKKRGSIFGNLIRNASKAGKSKKEKDVHATPAKVEETVEPKDEKTDLSVVADNKDEPVIPTGAPTEPNSIGDVVPDAVTVGQAPKSNTPVATTA
ncbi:Pleckstrin homology domain-containing protein [Massariosphaeria phaeospora]|uniref:Pleckstrin homology domain-containing protein n=1 Tax=Massariosphaeria phaeospora TaxID=100035 RepID=A0A7C8I3J4_9PLEO|nr:Pleckstrin homology domain-containing protein [Massariosphaeria phaeospora]